jgi:predicted protein tyrosine phosphatase
MLLEHLSRERAEAYRDRRPYAMISLTDPGAALARLQDDPNRLGLLTLQFHDISHTPEEFASLVRRPERDHYILPTADHARQIVRFVREMAPRVEKIVIHCEAGISRSAGVGAAIAHCLGQTDLQFYEGSCPNHRVRRLVIQAWGRRS